MNETILKLLKSPVAGDQMLGLNLLLRDLPTLKDIIEYWETHGTEEGPMTSNMLTNYTINLGKKTYPGYNWNYYYRDNYSFYLDSYAIMLVQHPHPDSSGWNPTEL